MGALALASAALWLVMLALPWRPWSTRERLRDFENGASELAGDPITVLIPARNEAGTIGATLRAVLGQPGVVRAVVVDDESTDGTGAVAAAIPGADVVAGRARPSGWSGKLWAQQQGLATVDTPLVLLLDADIVLDAGIVAALVQRLERDRLDQVSVMATLPTGTLPEKLMLPAFVFFFRQLYPFAWVNRPDRPFAAAAGGCVLVRRAVLERIGAFGAWKGALIDDCELARRVRAVGGGIWLGLDHGVRSLRRHPDFRSLLATVRRTAYVQLGRSPLLLAVVAAIMLVLFVMPPVAMLGGLVSASPGATAAGAAAWLLSGLAYLPQVRFQGLHPAWSLSLPVAGVLFLAATLDSALRHHFGTGAGWKGRSYS